LRKIKHQRGGPRGSSFFVTNLPQICQALRGFTACSPQTPRALALMRFKGADFCLMQANGTSIR
jgi:hypothetical protein